MEFHQHHDPKVGHEKSQCAESINSPANQNQKIIQVDDTDLGFGQLGQLGHPRFKALEGRD